MLRWSKLVWMSDEELELHDLAEVNLSCAEGLPVPRPIDVEACLEKITLMTAYCRGWIEHHLYKFHQAPADFNNSVAYFNVLSLISALMHGFGIRYNPALLKDGLTNEKADFTVEDSFIHGLLFGEGGTCGTMPVLYAAVGRRLGYPIKLVEARTKTVSHLFARWDEPSERFNIEGTNGGLSTEPDEYYRTGYFEADPKIARRWPLLISLSPRQELAAFMIQRAVCWLDVGNQREATRAFLWAAALHPEVELYSEKASRIMNDWVARLRRTQPIGFPNVWCRPSERRFPVVLPLDLERNFNCLQAWESILNDPEFEERWWGPMRRREWLSRCVRQLSW